MKAIQINDKQLEPFKGRIKFIKYHQIRTQCESQNKNHCQAKLCPLFKYDELYLDGLFGLWCICRCFTKSIK